MNDIGYNRGKFGFDAENLAVLVCLDEQSPDIALGVQDGSGAGDQGTMFGYACRETDEYMPMPIVLAHRLTKRLAEARREKRGLLASRRQSPGHRRISLRPPVRVDSVVVSTQHHESVTAEELREFIENEVIAPVIPGIYR